MSWVKLSKSWHDTSVDYCEVCGNLLIKKYWRFTRADGVVLRACREDDENLVSWLADHYAAEGSSVNGGDTSG